MCIYQTQGYFSQKPLVSIHSHNHRLHRIYLHCGHHLRSLHTTITAWTTETAAPATAPRLGLVNGDATTVKILTHNSLTSRIQQLVARRSWRSMMIRNYT